jgi:hypothetical protein
MFDQNTSILGAQGFDSTQVKPAEDFSALPAGDYPVVVTNVEVKNTKAGTGQYLALEMTVSASQFQGRKVWSNLNLINPNPKAVEIAQRDLSAICIAVGRPRLSNERDLLGGSLIIKVIVKEDRNEVKAYKSGGVAPTPTPAYNPPAPVPTPAYIAPAPATAPAPAPGSFVPSW